MIDLSGWAGNGIQRMFFPVIGFISDFYDLKKMGRERDIAGDKKIN